mmetsp:Transcript_21448/g.36586  ORF Transcript_21448/g.36586 Transcript_21448/m.36586 type:complete len:300 (-) Transcript_21448:656-1555(-)
MGLKSKTTKQPDIEEQQQQIQTRKQPLLGEPIRPNVGTNETNRGSCCARIFFAFMPLLSSALIIAFLYILIFEGKNDPTQVLIAQAMAGYERQSEIMAIALMGSAFAIITTIAREVQIRVYFTRDGTYTCCLQAMNSIGALANILAYVGYLLTVFNKYDAEDETKAFLHVVGLLLFFILAPLYALLQCALLFKQTQYSMFIKIIFLLMAVLEYAVVIGYLVLKENAIIIEWFAVALISMYTGLFFVLFLIDPVDDELKEYFTLGCCRKKSGANERKDRPSVSKRNDPPANNRAEDIELA